MTRTRNAITRAFGKAFDDGQGGGTLGELLTRAILRLLSWDIPFIKYRMLDPGGRLLSQEDASAYLVIRATCKPWLLASLGRLTHYTMQVMPATQINPEVAIIFSRRKHEVRVKNWEWTDEENEVDLFEEWGDGYDKIICKYWGHYNISQLMQVPSIRIGAIDGVKHHLIQYGTPAYHYWTSCMEESEVAYHKESRHMWDAYERYFEGTEHRDSRHRTIPEGNRYSGRYSGPFTNPTSSTNREALEVGESGVTQGPRTVEVAPCGAEHFGHLPTRTP